MPDFHGFSEVSFRLLEELKLNSNRDWVNRNGSRYEDLRNRGVALVECCQPAHCFKI